MFADSINIVADLLFSGHAETAVPLDVLVMDVVGVLPHFMTTGGMAMALIMGWLSVAVWPTEARQ